MVDVGSARLLESVDIDRECVFPDGIVWMQLFTSGTPTPVDGTMPLIRLFFQVLG